MHEIIPGGKSEGQKDGICKHTKSCHGEVSVLVKFQIPLMFH